MANGQKLGPLGMSFGQTVGLTEMYLYKELNRFLFFVFFKNYVVIMLDLEKYCKTSAEHTHMCFTKLPLILTGHKTIN